MVGAAGFAAIRAHVEAYRETNPIPEPAPGPGEILVGEAVDVLYVPLQGIHARRGQFYCFAVNGNEVVRKGVQLGRSNRTHVEVVSGLEEGDRVLLYDPDLTQEGGAGNSSTSSGEKGGTESKKGRGSRKRPQS